MKLLVFQKGLMILRKDLLLLKLRIKIQEFQRDSSFQLEGPVLEALLALKFLKVLKVRLLLQALECLEVLVVLKV